MGQGTKSICIVTPFYKEAITRDEEISLKHLRHFLGRYDRCLVAPEGLKLDYPDFSIKRFDAGFFEDIPSYTRLLLSREFYEAFAGYKHILIYQFDCLAFSDELMRWCEMGYDYMGGPWLRSKKEPQRGFSRVGNGGLSLRRVESFLKVIDSQRYIKEHVSYL
ncbi:MAG: hypothetical protein HQ558_07510, partial [Candidatus Omnitrophica bacterium]|nr:hypothetical protein [Candidatus Omnitrophota bacterium]